MPVERVYGFVREFRGSWFRGESEGQGEYRNVPAVVMCRELSLVYLQRNEIARAKGRANTGVCLSRVYGFVRECRVRGFGVRAKVRANTGMCLSRLARVREFRVRGFGVRERET